MTMQHQLSDKYKHEKIIEQYNPKYKPNLFIFKKKGIKKFGVNQIASSTFRIINNYYYYKHRLKKTCHLARDS